ncbi:Gfo/Idh/MocA family protein [Verrucomicrobiota bacterium sgz303538]
MTDSATVSAPQKGTCLNRKPRLGFLGVGWIGYKRLEAIAASGLAEIAVIADPVLEAVEKAAELAPHAMRGHTLDDLLSTDIDGLVIATPSAQHATESIAALQRGLAVFCQKPLGRDAAEVRSTIEAARANDRLLGVDLSYRYTEAMQKIRPLVRSGELGHIFAVDLIFHNAYGPQKPWFYDPQLSGGGCVVDLGIHLVDAAFWVLDEPITGVASRLYHQGKRIEGRGSVSEDYATARLDLAGDTAINLACSWNLHAGRDAIIEAVFYGIEGGAALRNVNGSFHDFTAEHFTRTSRKVLSEPPDAWGGRAAVDWARKLANGSGYDSEVERLIDVTLALDAIYERASDA